MADTTSTFGPESPRGRAGPPGWALTVALDCERPRAPPLRLTLAGVERVEIGRGTARSATRTGRELRLELPDRWASQAHACLVRDGDGWTVEDAASKNGTLVNGHAVDRAALGDGDVLECGGTFMVLRRAEAPVRDLEVTAGPLHTLSPAFERELSMLPKIARSPLPILVRGDSGTGKEVVATTLHALSGREGRLVAVNCGAIPATLIESELFGSVRGAFSGAEERTGLVRSAAGGTLFLDEVAELPLPSQAALLRLLQEGEVLPLGAPKPVRVDVRVVSATHQPLEQLMDSGRLRRDLYARLRGYELRLPRLRARLEDLGLLTASLLARIEPDGRERRLSRAAARALFLHAWPFHVRELEQALRTAVAVATGPEIGAADLRLSEPLASRGDDVRERLIATLEQHHGNLSAVSRALATSRTQVKRLLQRYSLSADGFKRR